MKLKLTLMAVAATLALGYQAQAVSFVGVTTNYSKLNVALTVKTNIADVTTGNVTKSAFKTTKIDNKFLLNLFEGSEFASETFPDGAQLVIGWDWSGHVLVVDKTGTNVLFDAYNGSSSQYISINFDESSGAYTETYNDPSSAPGFDTWTEVNSGQFYLNSDANSISIDDHYTPVTQHFIQRWSATAYTSWNDSEKFQVSGAGDTIYGNDVTSINGIVTASGHGNGENTYWY